MRLKRKRKNGTINNNLPFSNASRGEEIETKKEKEIDN